MESKVKLFLNIDVDRGVVEVQRDYKTCSYCGYTGPGVILGDFKETGSQRHIFIAYCQDLDSCLHRQLSKSVLYGDK